MMIICQASVCDEKINYFLRGYSDHTKMISITSLLHTILSTLSENYNLKYALGL